MKRRVVITGIGIISPLGTTTESFWQNALAGQSSVSKIPGNWETYASYGSKLWAPLPHIPFEDFGITKVDRMQLDITSLLMIAAAKQALDHAGIRCTVIDEKKNIHRVSTVDPMRAGTYIGTGVGGACSLINSEVVHFFSKQKKEYQSLLEQQEKFPLLSEFNHYFRDMYRYIEKNPRFNPFIVSMIMPNAIAANLGIRFGLKKTNRTNSTACASGTIAIGDAFSAIQNNDIDFALTGGVEYLGDIYGGIFRGFDAARTLTRKNDTPQVANRPFDRDRDGFLFCEGGACILVIEELHHALKRKVPILCEINGYAESYDAHSIMMIEPDGKEIIRMLYNLLEYANKTVNDVDYINAHGTGTRQNDDIESYVIETIFPKTVSVNATKSLIGHSIGSAGAIEAAVVALSIRDQKTHASLNVQNPIRDLNFVLDSGERKIDAAISQSFAFGGNNAALLLTKYTP